MMSGAARPFARLPGCFPVGWVFGVWVVPAGRSGLSSRRLGQDLVFEEPGRNGEHLFGVPEPFVDHVRAQFEDGYADAFEFESGEVRSGD